MADTKTGDLIAKYKKLEKLVEEFESGKIDLDAGIEKFEEGLKMADECRKGLEKLENKVVVLKEKFGL